MDYVILIGRALSLILAIMYGFVCFGRLISKQSISGGQILLMSIGIVGFILFTWWL